MQNFDVAAIKQANPILKVVSASVTLKRSGSSYVGLCPFHPHHKGTPSFAVWPESGTWKCFGQCSEGGDVIKFVMKRDGLTFVQACQRLGGTATTDAPRRREPAPIVPDEPPGPDWQAVGWRLIERAHECLLGAEGRRPLGWGKDGEHSAVDYLRRCRLLSEHTIRRWQLGFIPKDTYMPHSAWGLPKPEGATHGVWLPRGIVIPTFTPDGNLWAVHVRRPEGEPKYPHITGSKKSLWGAGNVDRRCVFIFGGEFDAMLAEQHGAHLGGSCSPSTGEGSAWSHSWTSHLLNADVIVCAYDNDEAGRMGAWRNILSATGRSVMAEPFEGAKDLSDYARAGGDVAGWMRAQRERLLTCGDEPEALWERIESLHGIREEHPDYYEDLKIDFAIAAR